MSTPDRVVAFPPVPREWLSGCRARLKPQSRLEFATGQGQIILAQTLHYVMSGSAWSENTLRTRRGRDVACNYSFRMNFGNDFTNLMALLSLSNYDFSERNA